MPHPVQVVVTDDLRRSRVTVFFRSLLVIPHYVLLTLWSIVAEFAVIGAWFAALVTGRVPDGLHSFLATWVRYYTHVQAYWLLAADPFPSFSGDDHYPIDVLIAPAAPQSRLTVLFRIFIAIPALVINTLLGYLGVVVALIGWFAALALGRVPKGLRDTVAWTVRVNAQTLAYVSLLTDRYPEFEPGIVEGPVDGSGPIGSSITPADPEATLELRQVSKSFGSVQALTEVNLSVHAGEVMALVGDNGAGKSTLIKTVAGIHPAEGGQIFFQSQPVSLHGPSDAARLGIEIVYQDLALCDNLDVVQNMYLGREAHDPIYRLREPEMERHTAETLKTLAVTTIRSTRQKVATLSGGQRQSVAVARAVMWNSKVVILDEPTAALGVAQTRQVLDLVKRLAQQGLAVILVSHNLHDVFEVADRITVLRLGRDIGVYKVSETTQQEIVTAITAGVPTKVAGIAGTGEENA